MTVDVVLPKLGLTVLEAELGAWLRSVGDVVSAGDPLVEVHTDKADVEVEAPTSGVLESIFAEEGATVAVGAVIAVIAAGRAAPPRPTSGPVPTAVPATGGTGDRGTGDRGTVVEHRPGRPPSSPRARRRAAAAGIDLSSVRGTGPGGRVVARDVERTRHTTDPVSAEVVLTPTPTPTPQVAPTAAPTTAPEVVATATAAPDIGWGIRVLELDPGVLDAEPLDWTATLVWAAAQAARRSGAVHSAPGTLTVEVRPGPDRLPVTITTADHLTVEALRRRLGPVATPQAGDEPDLVVVDLGPSGLHDGVLTSTTTPTLIIGAPRAQVSPARSATAWTIAFRAVLTARMQAVPPADVDQVPGFLHLFGELVVGAGPPRVGNRSPATDG